MNRSYLLAGTILFGLASVLSLIVAIVDYKFAPNYVHGGCPSYECTYVPGSVKGTCMIYVNHTMYCSVFRDCPALPNIATKCYDNYNSFGQKGFCPLDLSCFHPERDNNILIFTVFLLTVAGVFVFASLVCLIQGFFDETTLGEKAHKVTSIFYPHDWKTRGNYGTIPA